MESDQSDLDVIMVGHWMLCGVGSSLIWTLHGWPMDALCGRVESEPDSGRYHGCDFLES